MKKMRNFFINWSEFITIPISLLLFWCSEKILYWIDPRSATYDSGIFQIILFAVIAFLFLHGVAWFVFKLTFPKAYRFFDNIFDDVINGEQDKATSQILTLFQKCVLVLTYFLGCLFALVLLARVIM
jgi:hypothetical protein